MFIDRNRIRKRRGQAFVELCVGLVAILVLVAAGVSFGIAWQKKTQTLMEARRQAAYLAWLGVDSGPGRFLGGWRAGADGRDYSPDDVPVGADWYGTLEPILDPLREPADLLRMGGGRYRFMERNAFADLYDWGEPAGITFGFARGYAVDTVEYDPVLAKLVTGTRRLEVKSRVYLPRLWIDP